MSGLVDPALDVFVCTSIFVDDTAQVDKLLNLFQVFVMKRYGVLFLVVYSHHLHLLGVDIEARLLNFFSEAGQLLLCVLVSVSSAKSRSSSCLVKVHWMPVFLSDVACFTIQSATRRKMVSDSKQP